MPSRRKSGHPPLKFHPNVVGQGAVSAALESRHSALNRTVTRLSARMMSYPSCDRHMAACYTSRQSLFRWIFVARMTYELLQHTAASPPGRRKIKSGHASHLRHHAYNRDRSPRGTDYSGPTKTKQWIITCLGSIRPLRSKSMSNLMSWFALLVRTGHCRTWILDSELFPHGRRFLLAGP